MMRRGDPLIAPYAIGLATAFILPIPAIWLLPAWANVRNWQLLLTALLAIYVAVRWRRLLPLITIDNDAWWRRPIPRRLLALLVVASLISFLSLAASRYYAFNTNGHPFSIFDWMLYNTNHRQFMVSPVCACNHFGVHASYILLPLVPLHRLFESPLLLVFVHGLVIWSGVLPAWLLAKRLLRSEPLALLFCAAFLTNAFTGRVVNYAFQFEIFFIPAGLWFAVGWIDRRRRIWMTSALLFLSVKEDGSFYLAAFASGALLAERERRGDATLILATSLVIAVINLGWAQPYFARGNAAQQPGYLGFWSAYGETLPEILLGMVSSPWRLLTDLITSHWWHMFGIFAFVPLLARAPLLAMAPALFIPGTSSTPFMREYGLYYTAPLLPFFFWSLAAGFERLSHASRRWMRSPALAAVVLLLAPLEGGGYMRFIAPRPQVMRDVAAVVAELDPPRRTVCAQTSLIPHLPYTWDLRPISPACLAQPGAIGLIHTKTKKYPHDVETLRGFVADNAAAVHRTYASGLELFARQPLQGY